MKIFVVKYRLLYNLNMLLLFFKTNSDLYKKVIVQLYFRKSHIPKLIAEPKIDNFYNQIHNREKERILNYHSTINLYLIS